MASIGTINGQVFLHIEGADPIHIAEVELPINLVGFLPGEE